MSSLALVHFSPGQALFLQQSKIHLTYELFRNKCSETTMQAHVCLFSKFSCECQTIKLACTVKMYLIILNHVNACVLVIV